MRLLLNRRLHLNMGNYEHDEVTASVEIDTVADADLLDHYGLTAEGVNGYADIQQFMREVLDDFIDPIAQEASLNTAEKDSYVFPYLNGKKDKK